MKALGIFLIGALAVAGGVVAATYVTKKKLERENEDDFYENWDGIDDEEDDWDFDFDEDMDVDDEPAPVPTISEVSIPEEKPVSFPTVGGDSTEEL